VMDVKSSQMKCCVPEKCVSTKAYYVFLARLDYIVEGRCWWWWWGVGGMRRVVMDEDRAREGRGMKQNEDEGQRSPSWLREGEGDCETEMERIRV